MQEYVHRRHARAGSDGDSRRCHKSLQGSRPSGNIISPKCIAFALVMATPGTRGMIQLMMTVSIFSAGIHILTIRISINARRAEDIQNKTADPYPLSDCHEGCQDDPPRQLKRLSRGIRRRTAGQILPGRARSQDYRSGPYTVCL